MRYHQLIIDTEVVTCVRIAVPAREAATGYIQADTMALLEDIAGGPENDLVFKGLARLDQ